MLVLRACLPKQEISSHRIHTVNWLLAMGAFDARAVRKAAPQQAATPTPTAHNDRSVDNVAPSDNSVRRPVSKAEVEPLSEASTREL